MPEQTFYIHPAGWETDAEEERFRLSSIDYLTAGTYNSYALFFRLEDEDKPRVVDVLSAGLSKTLSQARHLCGTIERNPDEGYSSVKKRDSTVRFVVQSLESGESPSIDDIEASHFSAARLGDLNLWSPYCRSVQANFVRGGLVFNMHHHHFANDVMGWAGFTHQLAENCYAIVNNTPFPAWDEKNLDRSRITKREPPDEEKIDGPPAPLRHPDQLPGVSLLFHLPKSKAAELKRLATPADGSWISTYDAFSAFIFQTLTRLRVPVFKPDLSGPLLWSEAVDMRRRFHSPTVPPRMQGNVLTVALSTTAPVPEPTVSEILTWPLWKVASYIRALTNSVTQEALDQMLEQIAMFRDKSALNIRIDSFPPMSILQTDHRDVNISAADFGFGTPIAYRQLLDRVTNGVIVVYPPRQNGNPDEGYEFAIFYERDLARTLVEDETWNQYFGYRGIDAVDSSYK
ncbi:transferase [Aspergillus unguis]